MAWVVISEQHKCEGYVESGVEAMSKAKQQKCQNEAIQVSVQVSRFPGSRGALSM